VITATYALPGKPSVTRSFTKDASDYFLRLTRQPPIRIDLASTFLNAHLPTAATRGSSFTLRIATENQKASYAPPSVTRIVLSTDAKLSASDAVIAERHEPAIAPEQKRGGSVTVTIARSVARGTYHLAVCADTTALVTEVDESNNCQWAPDTIQIF